MSFLDNTAQIQGLIENFAFVLGMFAILTLIHDWTRNIARPRRALFLGAVFGLMAAASMFIAYTPAEGILIDARYVFIGMSGLFLGPVAALITAAMTGAVRIHLGGAGMISGLAGILIVTTLAAFAHEWMRKRDKRITPKIIVISSIIVAAITMPVIFLIPAGATTVTLTEMARCVYAVNVGWAILMGLLLLQDQRRREMIDALTVSEKRAAEAMKAKSVFLAKMSHEIRTPLNGVMGFSDLLSRTRLDTAQQDYIQHIQTSCRSLLSIVNDILDFSSVESGKITLRPHSFHLRSALEGCLEQIRFDSDRKGLELRLEFHGESPDYIITDEVRLRQIVMNLLGNACKFTHHGYIKIGVTARRTGADQWDLNIIVSDTGIGIEKENHERIFEAFEQTDHYTTRSVGGTGLGLSITKNLVSLLNGHLSLDSIPGKGSRFAVRIPVKQGAPEKIKDDNAANTVSDAEQRGRARILVAEDNTINQMVLRTQLEQGGYNVTLVENGREALDVLAAEKFDLVLMDVQMPLIDGIEASLRIRTELEIDNAAMPIIAITAHALPTELKACLEAGMDDCITKPIATDTLYATIDEWLGLTGDGFFPNPKTVNHPSQDDDSVLNEQIMSDFIDFVGADQATSLYREFSYNIEKLLAVLESGGQPTVNGLHDISSAAGNLGMSRLRNLCGRMIEEMEAIQEPLSGTELEKMISVMRESLAAFEQFLFRTNARTPLTRDCISTETRQ